MLNLTTLYPLRYKQAPQGPSQGEIRLFYTPTGTVFRLRFIKSDINIVILYIYSLF